MSHRPSRPGSPTTAPWSVAPWSAAPRCALACAALAAAVLAVAAPAAHAQSGDDRDPADLTGLSVVAVGLGSARERVGDGAAPATGSTRLLGAARLTTWLRPTWALDLSAARFGPIDADAVTPVLLGAAWYPRASAAAPRVRPYVGASIGMFVRTLRAADGITYGSPYGTTRAPARTDAVPGARLGVGIDAFVGRRALVGALVGYHLAGQFPASEPRLGGVASRPAGPMLAVTAGLRLPRREP